MNTLQDTSATNAFTSLREAIDLANNTAGPDTIVFASSLFTNGPATISLTGVLPAIASATSPAGTLTITGPGANTLNISANNGNFSVFSIVSLGNLSISGVTVSGANFTSGNGGAFNNAGVLAISASTISGNSTSGFGGAINNFNGGTISVSNSTISNNSATNGGGGIANTFMLAAGLKIGKSLAEPDLLDAAKAVMATMTARGASVPIPVDVVCAKTFAADAVATVKAATDVQDDDLILDIGPVTAAQLAEQLKKAGTIVWNGPVGVFEFAAFENGTKTIAHAIAQSPAFSLAGGGDTLAAIAKYGIESDVDYISTGGGAFLEVLEGKTLPAFEVLGSRA